MEMMVMDETARLLAPVWRELTSRYSCARASSAIYEGIVKRYGSRERHYHTLDHVAEVLGHMARHGGSGRDHDAALFAAWFHDVVYDPRATDNEERSAEMARRALYKLDASDELGEEVVRLILATKGHAPDGLSHEGLIFLDADLAILGAAPERYAEYAAAIRAEYDWVPEETYRAGRRDFLREMLTRERIFHTEAFRALHESAARANIAGEISRLSDGA